jgi:hypothetical protein
MIERNNNKRVDAAVAWFAPRLEAFRIGDRVSCYIDHIVTHRRVPRRKSGLFNDHLYFLKTSSQFVGSLRTFVTDKENLKKYVRDQIGDKYNIPTLSILRSLYDAERYRYPDRCVILTNSLFWRSYCASLWRED